jgi:DNA-binding MltR family transcriptional regulator
MPNLHDLTLDQWNKNLNAFHAESDRGAALLAASFVENHLGSMLKSKMKNRDKAQDLFEGAGGLATFSQRISIAYAFGFIGKPERDDLELLRRIRNHFAHHPLDASFKTSEIQQRVERLSNFQHDASNWPPEVQHRTAYLMACALLSAFFDLSIENPLLDIKRQP